MKIIGVVDRICEDIAVIIPDNGDEPVEFNIRCNPEIKVNTAVVIENGIIRKADETEHKSRMQENKQRLNSLFNKNK